MTVVEKENTMEALRVSMRVQGAPEQARRSEPDSGGERSKWWVAAGTFLLVLAVYVLSSPGRIDSIDGQARFEVAYHWVVDGRPIITDPFLEGVPGRDGYRYSYFGAPVSIFAMPMIWLGLHISPLAIQLSQFLFALTSPIFGAGIALVLFLFYLALGVTARSAFLWTMAASFATYLWPISTTVFDNTQHAFFALCAVYCGFIGARRKSTAYALLGGLAAGTLILYQEYFLLIIPALAISTLPGRFGTDSSAMDRRAERELPRRGLLGFIREEASAWLELVRNARTRSGEARSSCVRYIVFVTGAAAGLLLTLVYNYLRFGSWLDDGKLHSVTKWNSSQVVGNPLIGLLTLLASPGKGILLYSPVIILAVLGIRELRNRAPQLATTIVGTSLALVLFISCISFAGGDWCWGPRYLAPLLPLWALALPFTVKFKVCRELAVALIGAGLLVQVLALSVDNERFFLERGLSAHFWEEDPWFYFKHSALFARIGEVESLNEPMPSTAQWFGATPAAQEGENNDQQKPSQTARRPDPSLTRNFKIYFLPRPWPLWMSWLPSRLRPLNLGAWLLGTLSLACLGAGAIYRGLQVEECG